MPKQAFKPLERKFDIKTIIAGNSGSGKTDFCSSYLSGPVHFYMIDKGGEKTLEKNRHKRTESNPTLSVDVLSDSENLFSDFWHQLQVDAKEGFFDEMAEQNGLVVIDSLTSLNAKAIKEIMKKNSLNPGAIGKKLNMKNNMSMPHWGQLLSWMKTFTETILDLPCAVIVTVHLHTLMNSDQEVVARYPSVNGQFRQLIAVDFDEAYLIEAKRDKHVIHFKESNKFEAKSRVFSMQKIVNPIMDDLVKAYMLGKETF